MPPLVWYSHRMATPEHPQSKESTSSPTEPAPKTRKEIPLVSVPNDRDMIADEMAELFDEDKVTHQHGSSEPEAD